MLAQGVGPIETIVIVVYLLLIGYLGWLGYARTKTAADYMIAGRKAHPFVMAMSYGATFISTSAIVGFGGVAGLFGMSLLWLTFLNIFVGIFIAFVFFGGRTRKIGHHLDAHTFPELMGRRYQSKFLQVFAGLVIFFFIPLYSAAVLIGGCEFIATKFDITYNTALLVFSVIVAAYVVVGGLKGVMYTDALQGSIMFIGMLILLVYSYILVGGINDGHASLGALADMVPGALKDMGHKGWTATPAFGWGEKGYDLWWIVFSTIVLGVGIGVLAQPQLTVRFMTVKSKRELNRATLIGGVFILIMTGVAFTVGALSNVYFSQHGPVMEGRAIKVISQEKNHVAIQLVKRNDAGEWSDVKKPDGSPAIVPVVLDPQLGSDAIALADGTEASLVRGRSISVVYAGHSDNIIPTYITSAMPKWFGIVFLLTLLAAAMSTLSSQFHALGTSIGRDVFEQVTNNHKHTTNVIRIGIIVGIVIAVLISAYSRGGYIIARATAIFFGLCASAFLPTFVGGLFWRRATRAGAAASMVVGFVVTALWLLLVKAKEAAVLNLPQMIANKPSLLNSPNWPEVDPLVIALPISALVFIVVSLLSKKPSDEHLNKCFGR